MVSKIRSFDYLNASKEDYQEFAKEFYKFMEKKYHIDVYISFNDGYFVGNASSICTYDIDFKPKYIHCLSFNIDKIFKKNKDLNIRFLELVCSLFHELYHILTMENATKNSCFSLTSLFSALEYANNDNNNFWDINYEWIDEENNANIYSFKNTASFMKKYYPDAYDKKLLKEEINRYITTKYFYSDYYYQGQKEAKTKTLNNMINNFELFDDEPYPTIINKVFNVKKGEAKTIDELIIDYNYYLYKYPQKTMAIKKFYAVIITEKFLNQENYTINNDLVSLLKYGLNIKKLNLKHLQRIHPIKLNNMIMQNRSINNQQNTINSLETAIKGLF